jgi:hypothetical protein
MRGGLLVYLIGTWILPYLEYLIFPVNIGSYVALYFLFQDNPEYGEIGKIDDQALLSPVKRISDYAGMEKAQGILSDCAGEDVKISWSKSQGTESIVYFFIGNLTCEFFRAAATQTRFPWSHRNLVFVKAETRNQGIEKVRRDVYQAGRIKQGIFFESSLDRDGDEMEIEYSVNDKLENMDFLLIAVAEAKESGFSPKFDYGWKSILKRAREYLTVFSFHSTYFPSITVRIPSSKGKLPALMGFFERMTRHLSSMDNQFHVSTLNYCFVDAITLKYDTIKHWIGILFGLISPLIVCSLKGIKHHTLLYSIALFLSVITLIAPSLALIFNPIINFLAIPLMIRSLRNS